jgi:hypothetical protein
MHVVKLVLDGLTAMNTGIAVVLVMIHCIPTLMFRRKILPPSADDVYPDNE